METVKYKEYDNIFICGPCENEIKNLYKKDPQLTTQYDIWLHKRLLFLDSRGLLDLLESMPKIFEKVQGASEELYIIRHREFNGNPRILFLANLENGEYTYVLLTAFHELNRGDYKRSIKCAEARIKSL